MTPVVALARFPLTAKARAKVAAGRLTGCRLNQATTILTLTAGDMGNSLAPNGFGAHSTRPVS
jgi:hypothetical protein